jgi:tetratricopeptide (TPR) repeat protein
MLLFFTLAKYLKKNLIVPFVASLLFIAHPIHTEAVANIKSIDEMLSFFFAVLAMNFLYTALVNGKRMYMPGAMAAYMLSLLSKESGITFLAVFPLAIYFFTDVPLKKNLSAVLYMCIPVGIFLLLRHNVLAGSLKTNFSEVDNYLVAAPNGVVKLATAIFLLGLYLKLLFFPHPLAIDYSFKQLPFVGPGDWQFWISFLAYATLIVIAIRGFKKKSGIAFSILYFLVTLSIFSNILITIGTSFGERLMLIPSLGFCLALAFAGAQWLPASKTDFTRAKDFFSTNVKLMALCGAVVVLYGFKTIERNGDWADNYSIFSHDVKVSTKSAHMHNYFGNLLSKPENLGRKDSASVALTYDTAIIELKKAIEIFPKYADCYNQMGVIYYRKKAYKDAYDCYTKAIEYNNTNAVFHNNIGTMFFETHDYQNALKAIQRAVELDPNYTDALANLASTYGTLKDYENALTYLHRCIKVDPNYTNAYYFLSITYSNTGDRTNADLYMAKYEKVKKETDSKGVPGIGD